jgi:hypothetical protein
MLMSEAQIPEWFPSETLSLELPALECCSSQRAASTLVTSVLTIQVKMTHPFLSNLLPDTLAAVERAFADHWVCLLSRSLLCQMGGHTH